MHTHGCILKFISKLNTIDGNLYIFVNSWKNLEMILYGRICEFFYFLLNKIIYYFLRYVFCYCHSMYLVQITCFKLVMKIELLPKCIENEQNNFKKRICASLNPFSNFLLKFISIYHVPPLVDIFFLSLSKY